MGTISETRGRTLLKAVLWNLLGLAVMAGVGLAMTGSATLGGTMALVNAALGLLCYFLYERAWAHVRWGRVEGEARHG
ncbi:DUF2061 domain-containing protein [Acidimangrovimonas sediminis]|uniref:DUF2061 domain-containing protein n=1 Tax=Acidimangrovimonas sediminis TaxID=2056283 RepID=UPI000C801FA6|nr:DUF2061 domain-containing protein [Acidimangrovimonas sediminis]